MVFYWSFSDSKSSQVSRTILSILADIDNAVVWMISPCPHIPKPSSPFTNPLVTLPSAPITIGVTITFMFSSLFVFSFSSKVLVLIPLFAFFQFYLVFDREGKVYYSAGSLLSFVFFFVVVDHH